jgi:hypothetical protein
LDNWKKQALENGPELYSRNHEANQQQKKRVAELEQLLGKKEVEIALLKNWLG